MQRDLFKRDLVQFGWPARTQEEFFQAIIKKLEDKGFVHPSFGPAIRKREQAYPTALPTVPEAIAIPHSDAEHIRKPFISVTRLAKPVKWAEMANNDTVHPVRFIFMLGFTKSDGHVEVLQTLLQNFQQPDFIKSMQDAASESDLFQVIQTMQGLKS